MNAIATAIKPAKVAPSKQVHVQPKLTIGAVNDPAEMEADRVADHVMRMPSPTMSGSDASPPPSTPNGGGKTGSTPPIINRKCEGCEEEEVQRKPADGPILATPVIRMKSTSGDGGGAPSPSSEAAIKSLGSGTPLPASERSFFEPRFGRDLSNVRIHTGGAADTASKSIGARAFTLGNNIAFANGQYNPGSHSGRSLMAHELTHTVQQNREDIISCAYYDLNVGTKQLRVNIDYGNVTYEYGASLAPAIRTNYTALTGQPGTDLDAVITGLNFGQQRWLLFAIDLLADNRTAASGLDLKQAVDLVAARASNPQNQIFNAGNRFAFAEEVLSVSGWYDRALGNQLPALNATEESDAQAEINAGVGGGSGGSSACPSPRAQTLDTARFRTDLPRGLLPFLQQRAPASGQIPQSLPTLSPIADEIQGIALTEFAPYASRGSHNVVAENWQYSANLRSTQTTPITPELRRSYIRSRANMFGNGGLYARTHFDPRCPADRAVLTSIVTTMETQSAVQTIVDSILRELSHTDPARPRTVTLDTSRASTMPLCRARWSVIETMCHELLHVMSHDSFRSHRAGRQVLIEGYTEVLGDQLYDAVRRRASGTNRTNRSLKGRVEAGLTGCPATIPQSRLGYGRAGTRARDIRTAVGNDRFRAAYFLGRVELIGIQPKLTIGAVNDPAEIEADRVADQVMRMPTSQVSSPKIGSTPSIINRKCAGCEEEEIQRKPADTQAMEPPVIRMKSTGGDGGGMAPNPSYEAAINGLGSGVPLPTSERSFFEPRFGRDLSNVRVHTGNAADTASKSIGARAFTLGNNIAFANGEYSPGTLRSRHLMAHELTHTVQQSGRRGNLSDSNIQRQEVPEESGRNLTPPGPSSGATTTPTGGPTTSVLISPSCSAAQNAAVVDIVNQTLIWLDDVYQQLVHYDASEVFSDVLAVGPDHARVNAAVQQAFNTSDIRYIEVIRRRFLHMSSVLRSANLLTINCVGQHCTANGSFTAAYVEGPNEMTICTFGVPGSRPIGTFIHELAHAVVPQIGIGNAVDGGQARVTDRAYSDDRVFSFLSPEETLDNADSYSVLADLLHNRPATPIVPSVNDTTSNCGQPDQALEAFARSDQAHHFALHELDTDVTLLQGGLLNTLNSGNLAMLNRAFPNIATTQDLDALVDLFRRIKRSGFNSVNPNLNCALANDANCHNADAYAMGGKVTSSNTTVVQIQTAEPITLCPSWSNLSAADRIRTVYVAFLLGRPTWITQGLVLSDSLNFVDGALSILNESVPAPTSTSAADHIRSNDEYRRQNPGSIP